MQITYNEALRPLGGMAFALGRSRDYMMRSEKRPSNRSGSGRKKPPRRRRRAGFFYTLFTILLSLIFWPIGMIMLWRRKVRWSVGAKLLFSVMSLFVCIFLIVFAITVPTGNEDITRAQDSINDFLDSATTGIAKGYEVVYEKCGKAIGDISDFAEVYAAFTSNRLADGIDTVLDLTTSAREAIVERFNTDDPEVTTTTTTKDVTATPAPAASASPRPSAAVTASASLAPDADSSASPKATTAATPATKAATDGIAVQLPGNTPDPASAVALEGGTLTGEGKMLPGVMPENAATATPKVTTPPTATPIVQVEVKNPGEAVVYFNQSGTCYHMAESCKNMNTAAQHTLAEAVAAGKIRCRTCGSPAGELLEAENVLWTDENQVLHTTDECTDFEGLWNLVSLDDGLAEGYTLCESCHADAFCLSAGIELPTPTPEPTLTPSPVPDPTATPEPRTVTPSVTLKPAGEATVYHSSNGSYYHRFEVCKGMSGSSTYTLAECVDGNYKRCRTCDAPLPELVGEMCLWIDENQACHTSDSCSLFSGRYTLMLRDEALEKGMSGCIECGADEYLQPNTTIVSK